jgi:hypothetical protein
MAGKLFFLKMGRPRVSRSIDSIHKNKYFFSFLFLPEEDEQEGYRPRGGWGCNELIYDTTDAPISDNIPLPPFSLFAHIYGCPVFYTRQ